MVELVWHLLIWWQQRALERDQQAAIARHMAGSSSPETVDMPTHCR